MGYEEAMDYLKDEADIREAEAQELHELRDQIATLTKERDEARTDRRTLAAQVRQMRGVLRFAQGIDKRDVSVIKSALALPVTDAEKEVG